MPRSVNLGLGVDHKIQSKIYQLFLQQDQGAL